MPDTTYLKVDIARQQIETAVRIFEEGEDLFSVVTLAGASEEILGKDLLRRGIGSALNDTIEGTRALHRHLYGEDASVQSIVTRANHARNAFKHFGTIDEESVCVDLHEEAKNMLERAITNHWRLGRPLTPAMLRFEDLCNPARSVKGEQVQQAAELQIVGAPLTEDFKDGDAETRTIASFFGKLSQKNLSEVLQKLSEHAHSYGKEASSALRQLSLGGLAVVWLFKVGGPAASSTIELGDALLWPVLFFIAALAADAAYWGLNAVFWGASKKLHLR